MKKLRCPRKLKKQLKHYIYALVSAEDRIITLYDVQKSRGFFYLNTK